MRPFTPATRSLPGSLPSNNKSPAKSILKVPSVLGARRDRHDAFSSDPECTDTPTKRRKVLFDDIKNVTYEVGPRTMDEVKLEVRMALEAHLRGDDGQYDTIKEIFANDRQRYLPPVIGHDDDTLKPHELQVYVMALTGCVPILKSKECNGLVRTMLSCSWLGRDAAFVKVFTHFLTALVSAQGSYLNVVLSMLVDKFHYTRRTQWTVPDFPEVGRDAMRQRLHSALQYILEMFPSAKAVLENLLSTKFPFPDETMRVHMAYIHNLLRVKDYVPDLADDIYDMILNRVVKIDSQMQLDLEDMDDDIAAAVMYALREAPRESNDWEANANDDDADEDDEDGADADGEETDGESVDSDDADYDPEAVRIKTVKESVEKMDAVLDTLFKLYTPHFRNPGSDKAFHMFTTILREFDQMVLPTYKSRHTQFLIFHFAQQHERLTDAFCGQLIATAFQGNTPNILKQAAAAYLASFVARGAHVPQSLVRTIFLLLIHHLDRYRRKYEPACRGPDLKRFHPYYSLLQATLYIFCFRWQDLVVAAPDIVDRDDPASYIGQDLEWVGSSKQSLSIHVFGKLNPLKVCAPVIVEEFAKLAHRLGFMYTYPLIENNKRIRLTQFLSSTYSTGGALRDSGFDAQEESFHQLDPYFPFDPYQLPKSKRWLAEDYVHWKSVPGLNADDESDESEDDEDDEKEELEIEIEEVEEVEEETATDSDGDDFE